MKTRLLSIALLLTMVCMVAYAKSGLQLTEIQYDIPVAPDGDLMATARGNLPETNSLSCISSLGGIQLYWFLVSDVIRSDRIYDCSTEE